MSTVFKKIYGILKNKNFRSKNKTEDLFSI